MKYLIIFFLLLIPFAGCEKNSSNKVELVPNYNEIYLPPYKVDSPAQLVKGNTKGLYIKVDSLAKKLNSGMNISLAYTLLINENGDVDKVKVDMGPNNEYADLVFNTVKNWKFEPAKKDGKAVKSQYRWRYESNIQATNGENINVNEYFVKVSQMPEPIGGIAAIQKKVHYPEIAKRAGIEGRVFVKAFIDEKGNVVATEILKGVGTGLDQAAAKAITGTKFKPGMQNGKPVKVQVVVPIVFKL